MKVNGPLRPDSRRDGDHTPRAEPSASARILIVEDDSTESKYIRESLHALGYEVASEVSTGDEALKAVEEREVDLVLMDIGLPGAINGIQAADRIHTQKDVPVVYLTAYADDRTVGRAKETHPYGYLVKPYKLRELKAAVEVALHRHRMERGLRESYERYHDLFEDTLSHELGNRLGAAETAAQVLLSSPDLDADRRVQLGRLILEAVRGGKQAAKDLAACARPYSLGSDTSASLSLVVNEAVQLARHREVARGISISLVGEIPDAPVPASPLRIALANLLSNAVKHHRGSGPDRWVRVSASLDKVAQTVEIAVEDNGPGIPQSAREKVFDSGFRGDFNNEGSGMGLTITREVMTQAGGSISLGEGTESGAVFTLTVPVSEK